MPSPQFAPRVHPARAHLDAAGRRWPGLWAAADAIRVAHPQAPECYINDYWGAAALVDSIFDRDDEADISMLRGLNALEAARLGNPLTTLICWRMTQGIYRIDPALYDALISTPLDGDIPVDVLLRLPEWCIYIETPGLRVYRRAGGYADLRGAFVRIDVEDGGARNLVITLDIPEIDWLESQSIPLRGTLDAALDVALREWAQDVPAHVMEAMQSYTRPIINLALYICAGSDTTGKHGTPANPEPKRTKRGWRLFGAEGVRMWDVGVRMGAALRRAYQAAEMAPTPTGGGHAAPRPHVRRAHWHTFLLGPRAGERRAEVRWLPPIAVNLDDVGDLPATIKPVRGGAA